MPSASRGSRAETIATAPSVCRDCVWWQSRGNRTASKERWIERVEEDYGEWGTLYYDDDGRLLGSMQYGAPRCSRGPTTCRRGRPPTMRCSSPAPT